MLIYQVKGLLDNMGIICAVRQKKSWATNGSHQQVPKVSYRLSINRASFFDFYNEIGFVSERKNGILKIAIDHLSSVRKSINFLTRGKENRIPAEAIKQYTRRLRQLSGETVVTVEQKTHDQLVSYPRALGEWHCFSPNAPIKKLDTRGWCSRYLAEKILSIHLEEHVHPVLKEKVSKDEILATLRAVVKEQLSHVWMQVSKIVIHNEETPVYDLSIKGKREYSASGFMSHNSQMALNLMNRAYLGGNEVIMASYEMSYEQIVARTLSIISNLPHDRIRSRSLTKQEKRFLEWSWYSYILKGLEKKNNFWLACPTSQNTVFEVGMRYKSKKPIAIIFDYINLLKTNSKHSEAQWMMLGEIAKEGKVLARKLNCVVFLLVQVDKEHNFRYSQAIKDHADWIWTWVYDEEAKTNGFVTVKQLKTRSAPSYDFQLITRFDVSQFRDPEEEEPAFVFSDAAYDAIIAQAKQLGLYGRTMKEAMAIASPLALAPRTTPPRLYAVD
jgi:replicative DNA helicase